MHLLPLLLGGLAVLNPFIGLILMMFYSSYGIRQSGFSPIRMLLLFLVFPLISLFTMREIPGVQLMASDAIWAVGLVTVLFLHSLRAGKSLAAAFTLAAMLIIFYGSARCFVFGDYLTHANEQAISDVTNRFPSIYKRQDMQFSISVMRYLWPASWTIPQLFSLFAGYIMFHNLNGVRFQWCKISFPKYLNFIILAILPLYMVTELHQVFVNTLLTLLVLPAIQGFSLMVDWLAKLVSSRVILAVLLLLLIPNYILISLLGFTDIWLDFRKLNTIKE